ncbi:MAG: signal recognition particle protein [Christensenellales bacterium]
MALFSSLSERIGRIFSKLSSRGKLTEYEIKDAMREIRVALLEADVNFLVVKDLINKISEKALGEQILKSLSPTQQVIKIVNEELTALMGSVNSKLNSSSTPPNIIMLCGLQDAGKTTTVGKLALMLKKQGKKVLTVGLDVYRPAAINQLKVVSSNAGVECFEKGTQNPIQTAKEAVDFALKRGLDTVILDTAGRLSIDETLMNELKAIKDKVHPTEILLTVDSMTGQEAVNVAKTFDEKLDITGVILTKLDGDTRGGAALSIKAVVNKPIKFCCVGEKIGDIEPFYPDRMASRILGMGDVLTLIEKAQQAVSEEEAKKMEEKFRKNKFDFEDYLVQFENLKKMGSLKDIMAMIPGLSSKAKLIDSIDEKALAKNKAIIQSMTIEERRNPDLIKGQRRKRICEGSGTTIQEVNALLKQFEQTKEMMKQLNGKKGFGRFPF